MVHDYPVFRCRSLFHRDGAVFPATVVGKPRQEDYHLGGYLQRLLAPLFPVVMPGVIDLWSYGETGFHPLAAAVVRERYPRECMASAFRILGEGQLSLTKFLIVLDHAVDLSNARALLADVLERVRWERDLYIFNHLSQDTLDYTGPEVNRGSKGVLLGVGAPVRRLPEHFEGQLPRGFADAEVFCPGCVVISGPTYSEAMDAASILARQPSLDDWPLVVLVDDARQATASVTRFLWTTFTRFEPAGDIAARSARLERHHVAYSGPVVIDARMKPWYPAELFCDAGTAATVSRRWNEYFPSGRVSMGDSGGAHLDRTDSAVTVPA
jgi:3-polyprenyl-4-hydroxybenzoate decarboxylase